MCIKVNLNNYRSPIYQSSLRRLISIFFMSISDDESLSDDHASDTISAIDYLPISADDDEESDASDNIAFETIRDHRYANGGDCSSGNSLFDLGTNDGISALDLNGEGGEEEEEEEEREREREDSIRRAFGEDERRRNAPLTDENAVRVMEAMRGVSFVGLPPDWVGHIPEERWVNQLRSLRTTEGGGGNVGNLAPTTSPTA